MSAPKIEAVAVNFPFDNNQAQVGWTVNGARYHFWCKAPNLSPLTGTTDRKPTLYKNPPADMKRNSEGWHDTRHLDATKATNHAMIEAVCYIVNRDGLVAKAKRARDIKEGERLAALAADHAAQIELELFGTRGRNLLRAVETLLALPAWNNAAQMAALSNIAAIVAAHKEEPAPEIAPPPHEVDGAES